MKRALILTVALASAGCMTHVDAGHVGVEVNSCGGGGVKPEPVNVGYHGTGPCTTIIEYPVFQQTMMLTQARGEGTDGDGSITVTSSEGLPISVDISLSFTIEPGKVPHVYSKFRKDLAHIQQTYIRQSIREGVQETFAKYTAQQIYSDKKEFARAEIQGFLTKRLGADGFNVTQFTVNETRVPSEVLNAIKSKVAMVQEAQRAEQQVAKSTAIGQQRVAEATADATAKKLTADAEAYSNRKIAESISGTLVDYMRVQKWDGKLPQVSGGGNPFISLGKP